MIMLTQLTIYILHLPDKTDARGRHNAEQTLSTDCVWVENKAVSTDRQ